MSAPIARLAQKITHLSVKIAAVTCNQGPKGNNRRTIRRTKQEIAGEKAGEIFVSKAEHRNLDPTDFPDKYATRIEQYQKRWQPELSNYVPGNLPHFKGIERQITRALRQANLL